MRGRLVKKGILFAALSALLLLTAGCAQNVRWLDVVGSASVSSFEAMFGALPAPVALDAAAGGFSIDAQDGGARLYLSADFSQSPGGDVMLVMDAAPFIGAGLNPAKLTAPYAYSEAENTLTIWKEYGDDAFSYESDATPISAYAQFVALYPEGIGYHAPLDHFHILLDGGMFEWAKTLEENEKDIVFALSPEPLLQAGLAPEAVEGWLFAKVPTGGMGGASEMDMLLKVFDLR